MNYITLQKNMFILFFCITTSLHAVNFTSEIIEKTITKQVISIHCSLEENESILLRSLHASVDRPGMHVSKLIFNIPTVKKYIPEFQQKKMVFDKNFTITISIKALDTKQPIYAILHLNYVSTLKNSVLDVQIPIAFECFSKSQECNDMLEQTKADSIPMPIDLEKKESFAVWVQNLVETTKSPGHKLYLPYFLDFF